MKNAERSESEACLLLEATASSPRPFPPSCVRKRGGLTVGRTLLLTIGAASAFQLAYIVPACGILIAVFLYCVVQLSRLGSSKQASYVGLAVGLLCYAPQLGFFWRIFGPAAVALWLVLAFWLRIFLILARLCQARLGPVRTALLMPFLWTGLEYFRSELYYLRFSWLNAGYVFSGPPHSVMLPVLGMYGVGFVLMAAASGLTLISPRKQIVVGASLLLLGGALTNLPAIDSPSIVHPQGNLPVAGVQMEFPSEAEIISNLNRLVKAHPEAQLLVLSEYAFDGPVPERVKAWCRKQQRYLVIGAKDPAPDANYYDTAFVVAPSGEIVFKQGKKVPIQFFKDGLPAPAQKLWDSPWGKIGICICYDLSYTRVTDELIRLGARALIVPTMDVVDWGRHQHEMHAIVAPVRAAEYGIPIFRVASSGISQLVDADGRTAASAPMPGDGAMLAGTLDLNRAGRLPLDRAIAPVSVGVTGLVIGWLCVAGLRGKFRPAVVPTPAAQTI